MVWPVQSILIFFHGMTATKDIAKNLVIPNGETNEVRGKLTLLGVPNTDRIIATPIVYLVTDDVPQQCQWKITGKVKNITAAANKIWANADPDVKVHINIPDLGLFLFGATNISLWLEESELGISFSSKTTKELISDLEAKNKGAGELAARLILVPGSKELTSIWLGVIPLSYASLANNLGAEPDSEGVPHILLRLDEKEQGADKTFSNGLSVTGSILIQEKEERGFDLEVLGLIVGGSESLEGWNLIHSMPSYRKMVTDTIRSSYLGSATTASRWEAAISKWQEEEFPHSKKAKPVFKEIETGPPRRDVTLSGGPTDSDDEEGEGDQSMLNLLAATGGVVEELPGNVPGTRRSDHLSTRGERSLLELASVIRDGIVAGFNPMMQIMERTQGGFKRHREEEELTASGPTKVTFVNHHGEDNAHDIVDWTVRSKLQAYKGDQKAFWKKMPRVNKPILEDLRNTHVTDNHISSKTIVKMHDRGAELSSKMFLEANANVDQRPGRIRLNQAGTEGAFQRDYVEAQSVWALVEAAWNYADCIRAIRPEDWSGHVLLKTMHEVRFFKGAARGDDRKQLRMLKEFFDNVLRLNSMRGFPKGEARGKS